MLATADPSLAHLQQLAGAFSGAAIDFLSFFRHQFAAEPEM
jgi:hypothetical protein